jgi:hypothetical protein
MGPFPIKTNLYVVRHLDEEKRAIVQDAGMI